MIKISAGIAYEQNRPTGLASALIAQFGFLGEKCLKNALYKNNFQTKVVTNHNTQLLLKIFFDRPAGLASALIAQFGFLAKRALKMR